MGATIVSAPREYPEYVPAGYYALFFKDQEGIKDEIVCLLIVKNRDTSETGGN
jgi:hypothetical protein